MKTDFYQHNSVKSTLKPTFYCLEHECFMRVYVKCLFILLIISDISLAWSLFYYKKTNSFATMKKIRRGILFIVYLLFWLVAFESMRIFFMLFNFANGFSCSVSEFFGALWHGLYLDMAMMAYIGIFVIPFFIH